VLYKWTREKTRKADVATSGEGDLAAGLNPQPPFAMGEDLYGEIVQAAHHLKVE
jgi:hypothetical protein